jgi:hypothetical protein
MPKGLPSAEQLMQGDIGGFSIDTCIFEALSFKLDTGEFSVLHQQLPPWLKLYVPNIVKREVISHQVRNVVRCSQELQSACRDITRYTGCDVKKITDSLEALKLDRIGDVFETQLETYVRKFKGRVLVESGDKLLKEMFDRYFGNRPPFENTKDKKFEFPDAAALLALEQQTKKVKKLFLVVSNDRGWKEFCDQSEALFCVPTLRDLTSLYQADSKITAAIEGHVAKLLTDPESSLSEEVTSALIHGVPNCSWVVEAYTGSCSGIEAELESAQFVSFDPNIEFFQLWFSKGIHEIAVVEIRLKVMSEFEANAAFSTWDSIDHESITIGSGSKSFLNDVEMSLYLTLAGDLSEGDPSDWDVVVELSQQDYVIEAGEMEPDFHDYEE